MDPYIRIARGLPVSADPQRQGEDRALEAPVDLLERLPAAGTRMRDQAVGDIDGELRSAQAEGFPGCRT